MLYVLRTVLMLVAVLYPLLFYPATAQAAECRFVLGFATLRDLIGHDIVGECLESEHYNAIGDSVQQTSGGLFAWRKADNWTAFTDGYRTWVSGPFGVKQRLNTERFFWEGDYAEHIPIVEEGLCPNIETVLYVAKEMALFDAEIANSVDEWGGMVDQAVADKSLVHDSGWWVEYNDLHTSIRIRFEEIRQLEVSGWVAKAFKASLDAAAYHLLLALEHVAAYFDTGRQGIWNTDTLHKGHFHYERSLQFIYARPIDLQCSE